MSDKDVIVAWLNDAYAMEKQIAEVLGKQTGQAQNHPEIQQAIQTHLEQTKHHADLVKQAVEHFGGNTSSIKSGMATVMGWMQGLSTGPAQDTLVKDSLSDYGVENFEIASYRAIRAAATEMGDAFTINICDQILPQEEEMAQFLARHLTGLVQETLAELGTKSGS